MRVALAQIDPTVGDIDGNAAKIAEWIGRAAAEGAELVDLPRALRARLPGRGPLPEAALRRGEPARGRGARPARRRDLVALVGFAEPVAGGGDFRHAHNSLAVLADGAVRAVYRKNRLPNYSVFDEQRYFVPGDEPATIEVGGQQVGLTVCEDVWMPGPPASTEAEAGASLIANPSGSPYHRGKGREREAMFAERARAYGAHFAFCNLVGGQDELVFDGHSFVVDPERRGDRPRRPVRGGAAGLRGPLPQPGPARRAALRPGRGLRRPRRSACATTSRKNGFRHVGVALSGGIDSALVALLAVDALGPEHVSCVVMPSPHSSLETQADARTIATNLGTELIEIPIAPAMAEYESSLVGRVRAGQQR